MGFHSVVGPTRCQASLGLSSFWLLTHKVLLFNSRSINYVKLGRTAVRNIGYIFVRKELLLSNGGAKRLIANSAIQGDIAECHDLLSMVRG